MDRGSSKHGPRLDDEMAHETRGITQGSPTDGRAEEWHEPEPPGEDQPEASAVPYRDAGEAGGSPTGMTPGEREQRSRLGQYLRRSVFPADRTALIDEARENNAPDDIAARLSHLPAGVTYQTVAEVWAGLVDTSEDELEQRF
jgi:hypothetical protein